MSNTREWINGLAAAGAALRAAQAAPNDGWRLQGSSDTRVELVISDRMLVDKVLRLIYAGQECPADLDSDNFEDSARIIRSVALMLTHMNNKYPLVADPIEDPILNEVNT